MQALAPIPLMLMLVLAGCASSSSVTTCAETPAAETPAAESPADAQAEGPAARVVALPGVPGEGQPREVAVLVDEPALKLVTIVLRDGTVLPEHLAEVPVTIVAVQGSGTVIAGAERLRLDPSQAVVLAPRVPHAVEPDPGTDLVLLVHHVRGSR